MWSQQRGVQDHNPAAECQSQNGRLLPGGGNAKISPPKPPNYPSGQAICYKFHSVGCTSNTCGRDHGAPVAQVRASYLEDVEEGHAFGPMTEAQAEQMCGGPLVHGALGAVEEFKTLPTGEKVREKHLTIHDGTAVGVNPRIQRNLMGRTTYTTIRPRGAAYYENVAEIGPVETRHVRFGCEKCSPAMPLGPQRVAIRYSPSRRR